MDKRRGGGGGGGGPRGAGGPERKITGGMNKSAHTTVLGSARKLEEDTEHFAHATVDRSLSQAIQQARLAKKMTQKDLSAAIYEKPTIIADYEAGRAIPNPSLISKIERALDVRLPRPAKK